MTNLPHFFDRTSTFRVLEFFIEQKVSSIEQLIELFHQRGHRRTDTDIKRMFHHLERLKVIENWKLNPLFSDIDLIDESSTDRLMIKKMTDIIEFLYI